MGKNASKEGNYKTHEVSETLATGKQVILAGF